MVMCTRQNAFQSYRKILFYSIEAVQRQPGRQFLDSELEGHSPATRKGLAFTGFSGNATMPEFVAVGVITLKHCLRFMSRLADGISNL